MATVAASPRVTVRTTPRAHRPLLLVLVTTAFFALTVNAGPPQLGLRLFFLGCLMATMLVLRELTTTLFDSRAGLVSATIFGFSAPALYVANTLDAAVLLLLVSALYVAVAHDFTGPSLSLALLLLAAGLALKSSIGGSAHSNALVYFPQYLWPIGLAALAGLTFLVFSKQWRIAALCGGLVTAAIVLPGLLVHSLSFASHLAYSALFLAPVAGWGLVRPWRLPLWTAPLVFYLVIALLWGAFRAHEIF